MLFNKIIKEEPINRRKKLRKNEPIKTTLFEEKIEIQDLKTLDHIYVLEDLQKEAENIDLKIKEQSKNIVFLQKGINDVLIIGEAPGDEEDKIGKPFVGASGKLLEKMFTEVGLNLRDFYITNTVFWRPPNNRKPTEEEINTCKPYIQQIINIIKPKHILLLGAVALNSMIGNDYSITRHRGKPINEYFATFHPSYVLRMPKQKDLVIEDLKNFKKIMN